MIEINNLSIGYGRKKILEDVSSQFPGSKITALIGRNGSGKSTLIRTLCGLNDKYGGEILIDNENIRKIPKIRLSHKLAYVNTQRPRMANLKCRDVVSLGRSPYTNWNGKISEKDYKIIDEALESVGMRDYAGRYFNSLSDGESQKIMIARAIAQDTDIIILDEPTSFLDLPTRYELALLLKDLSEKKGKTIIYSTHELDLALHFSDYIALIDDKKIINLPVKEMIDSGMIDKLFPLDYLKESGRSFS